MKAQRLAMGLTAVNLVLLAFILARALPLATAAPDGPTSLDPASAEQDVVPVVDRVRPSVETLLSGRRDEDPECLLADAVRANVRASVDHLRHGSELLEKLIREDGVLVVGAEYSLETGVVTFFDGAPEDAVTRETLDGSPR